MIKGRFWKTTLNKIITSVKRKHVKCFGLFLWKSCHVNCRRSQGLMSAPGMIQTPWYSNDHLSNQNLSETSQSLARFFKNNNYFSKFGESCAWKNGKKDRKLKISKHVRSNFMGKRDCNILSFWLRGSQRFKLRYDLDWLPTSFLAVGAARR